MKFISSDPVDRDRLMAQVKRLCEKGAIIEIKEVRPLRTLSQNAYLHMLLQIFAAEYGCSVEEAKVDYYKRLCNHDLYEVRVRNRQGQSVRTLRSSRDLTTDQMALSIDRFKAWAKAGGITLPDADRLHDIDVAMVQVSRVEALMTEIPFT